MAVKLNTEFNYRYQVEGNTPWEKLKQLKSFLEGRERASALKQVSHLRLESMKEELKDLEENGGKKHLILRLQSDILEAESFEQTEKEAFELTLQEINILKKIIGELYAQLEPTRCNHPDGTPFTDEEMYELNAANEFTTMIGKEIYAEILTLGHPSPARIRNAMSNIHTWSALQIAGLIPKEAGILLSSADPLKIELKMEVSPELDTLLKEQQKIISEK